MLSEAISEQVRKAQHNYMGNIRAIDDILMAERGYFTRLAQMEDVVVLCSGGLDSTVMLEYLIDRWEVRLNLLYVRRGAKAEKYEEAAFDHYAAALRERHPFNIRDVRKLDCTIPPAQFKENYSRDFADTVGHPMRNSTMQNLAVMYAASLNASNGTSIRAVLVGSVGEDFYGPEGGLLSLRSQTLNTCINLGDWSWQITSPFIDPVLAQSPMGKAELIQYAATKGLALDRTRSCFSAGELADGTCSACVKRLAGFAEAAIPDPVTYMEAA